MSVTIYDTDLDGTLSQEEVDAQIGSANTITIDSGVAIIGTNAFANVTGLITSVTIPSSVTSIGASAFAGCSLITNTIAGLTLTNIEASAFEDCPVTITQLDLSGSTQTTIGENTFKNSNLQNIILPRTITALGTSSLSVATQLTSIRFHEDTVALAEESAAKATNIYLPPSILRANAVSGNIWATSNYYLYLSQDKFGPTGRILSDGSKIPKKFGGTMLRSKTVNNITTFIVTPFNSSFPETYYGYDDIPDQSNNIRVYSGFNVLCTKEGTDDPNNNSNPYMTIPGDAVSSTGFRLYTDNTTGYTKIYGTITSIHPNILLFYNDILIRAMLG